MYRALYVVVGLSIFASGCSGKLPECASDEIKQTVFGISIEGLSESDDIKQLYNLQKSVFDLNSIRTVTEESSIKLCKGVLTIKFELSDWMKNLRDTDEDAWNSLVWNSFRGEIPMESEKEILYSIELMDDGGFYVTIQAN